MSVMWAFDIETQDWDRFVLGAAVSDDGCVVVFNTAQEVARWYIALPSVDVVISHNGGSFDFLFLIQETPQLSWSANLAGSSIVTCRAKGHALCRDTYRLFPLSLAKWTLLKTETGLKCWFDRKGNIPDPKTGKRPWCQAPCAGYCRIRVDMSPEDRKKVEEYCVNDCCILLNRWKEDVARLEAEGFIVHTSRGMMRSTIGGVAWHTGATMAGLDPNAEGDWGDYDAGRVAYYGGRVEVGRVRWDGGGHRYDVHAMYPWALTHPVPCGERSVLLGAEAARAFDSRPLGLYHASVWLPHNDLPALPHRYRGRPTPRLHPERLIWSTGHVVGDWSGIELRNAVKHGARIMKIDQACVWSEEDAIFKPYVEHVYAMRRRAIDAGDDRWGSVLKWFANSISGKLAQRPGVSQLVVLAPDDDPGFGWDQHGSIKSRVYSQTMVRIPTSGLTWAAATLTARARVKLHERLSRHAGRWLYCDTDSTYLIDRDDEGVHESALGTWGYEGEAHAWLALAPKLYRYRDEHGKAHVRARGVPKASWEALDTLRAGGSVTSDGGVERIRTSEGRFKARTVTRSHRDAGSNRCGTRYVTGDGTTRPLRRTRDGTYE